jgi:hypothetical protein
MSVSSGFDNEGGSEGSLCVMVASSNSNNNDLRRDGQKEEVISNNSNSTIPIRYNISALSRFRFDAGGSEASLCFFAAKNDDDDDDDDDWSSRGKEEEGSDDDGGDGKSSSSRNMNAGGSQDMMTSSSYIDYRYGDTECAVPTNSSSSSINMSGNGRQDMMASSSSNISRRNSIDNNIIPRCSSHGARRANIATTAQNAAVSLSGSCTYMNSSSSIDYVTDYGNSSLSGNRTANGRRDMMAASSSNISRRKLFRRKSAAIASPRCSPHGRGKATIGVTIPNSATALNSSASMSSSSSIDYRYGEDVVPTTTGPGITTANGRQDMMAPTSRRNSSASASSRRAARRGDISCTDIGRRASVGGGTKPNSASSASAHSIPRRRISSASKDLLRMCNGSISLDDMTID